MSDAGNWVTGKADYWKPSFREELFSAVRE